MKSLAVARRYARALLLIGKEDGQAELYKRELNDIARLIADQSALEEAVVNPLYDAGGRRNVLKTVIEKLNLSQVMSAFMMLLFEKGRFGFLASINEFYQKLADEHEGIAHASVISAAELSEEAVEKIREALSQKTGKTVKLQVKQDAALIGGIVTKIGDLVFDGSIQTQLNSMSESFKRGGSI